MNDFAEKQKAFLEEFGKDSVMIGEQTDQFLKLAYPSYLVNRGNLENWLERDSRYCLESMRFFQICSCTADHEEKVFEYVNEQFEKLLTALHSINVPVAYGLVSRDGITHLVLGVYSGVDAESIRVIASGMLSGIELEEFSPDFSVKSNANNSHGILTGVPSLYVREQKQSFSLAPVMRSLNGQTYTLLIFAKPVSRETVSQNLSELISVRDRAFAVSKRNISRSRSYTENAEASFSNSWTKQDISAQAAGGAGLAYGTAAGAVIGTLVAPGVGTAVGAAVGGGIGSGLGTLIGTLAGQGKSSTNGYGGSISRAIADAGSISGDVQNGFAIELMNYANSTIERLKGGLGNGIWQTSIVYSAENAISRNIIQACLSGELSKPDPERLPMLAFEPKDSPDVLKIPCFLRGNSQNALCSYVSSSELGLLCTVPVESVPDFELRIEKRFPLIASRKKEDRIQVGYVADGRRPMSNMPFALSEQDLNKHTFICGITGSGKTTTVKKILAEAKKPFLVIESAKKEYRNIAVDTTVYTMGKPEINALQMNPFYIMPGVSPQMHIDYLKDLFNASFSFYGPMPYILEKCLHAVYRKKGWDLTLGYHPLLANTKSPMDLYSLEYAKTQYEKQSHKFLFPTMQELKDEITRYIEEELKYDGEVAGNVKTAMKVRLENLCVGAKGYSFNTSEFPDFRELLDKNVVIEMEGLADDSDKAFSLGLLVIFINEYRQTQKETGGSRATGLQHLLVIEEAHRLLKNVETERFSETSGNPKGKAVEHFTNMIAEMRSYGQGVIVAEQIPAKLAPDVIKNSSTKIIQRIVSADDQQIMANTIGISAEDAIQMGFLETGYAYCHKEGMVLPTTVKIQDTFIRNGKKQELDVYVSDEELYIHNTDRFKRINLSILRSSLSGNLFIKRKVMAFLNTIMTEDSDSCVKACEVLMSVIEDEVKTEDIHLTLAGYLPRLYAEILTEFVLSGMVRGVYCTKVLPDNRFVSLLQEAFYAPSRDKIREMKNFMREFYANDLKKYALVNIAALVEHSKKESTDVPATVREYFICVSESTVTEIEKLVKGGRKNG